MASDLNPGEVTTLGNLRPGDVARYLVNDDEPGTEFVVGGSRGTGVYVQYPNPANNHYGDDSSMVRYHGSGRIEPARIVMEGEPDRVAELLSILLRVWQEAGDGAPMRHALTPGLRAEICAALTPMKGEPCEQHRRVAELEEQARTLREALVQAAIPLEAINGSVSWELCKPLQESVSVAVKILRSTIAATAPKGETYTPAAPGKGGDVQ